MPDREPLDLVELAQKLAVIRHAICESRPNDALQAVKALEERVAEELKP